MKPEAKIDEGNKMFRISHDAHTTVRESLHNVSEFIALSWLSRERESERERERERERENPKQNYFVFILQENYA